MGRCFKWGNKVGNKVGSKLDNQWSSKLSQLGLNLGLSLLLVWSIVWALPALAATENGAKLFELNCAGCHINGGNIVRRGKNLKLKTLEKNQVNTLDAIAALVTNGKGNMSAYRDRLSPAEITDVSAFVLEQAQRDWR
jgi:cytochrome c6